MCLYVHSFYLKGFRGTEIYCVSYVVLLNMPAIFLKALTSYFWDKKDTYMYNSLEVHHLHGHIFLRLVTLPLLAVMPAQ